jgi:hypothetical protein
MLQLANPLAGELSLRLASARSGNAPSVTDFFSTDFPVTDFSTGVRGT